MLHNITNLKERLSETSYYMANCRDNFNDHANVMDRTLQCLEALTHIVDKHLNVPETKPDVAAEFLNMVAGLTKSVEVDKETEEVLSSDPLDNPGEDAINFLDDLIDKARAIKARTEGKYDQQNKESMATQERDGETSRADEPGTITAAAHRPGDSSVDAPTDPNSGGSR